MVEIGDRAKLEAEVEKRRQREPQEPARIAIPTRHAASDVRIDTISTVCQDCGVTFERKTILRDGEPVFVPRLCDKCSAAFHQQTVAAEEIEKQEKREGEWKELCPPLYRDTDPTKLKMPKATVDNALAWIPKPIGIGIAGESGAGKTRLMFMLLKKLHFDGFNCHAFTAKRFENWCHKMFDKDDSARLNIQNVKRAKVIFIDDIGKEKYTERVESEFYDLIEYRTSHLLPILWTANASGDQLAQMMGADRGVPIVRRLREFSTVISV